MAKSKVNCSRVRAVIRLNLMKEALTDKSVLILEEARNSAVPVPPLTKTVFEGEQNMSLDYAYRIQRMGIAMRNKAGDPIVGFKMGLTSKAKMEQMGLHTPIYGVLLKSMQIDPKNGYSLAGKIHPKIEPEVAFITNRELVGDVTLEQALAACEFIVPALEILDSRFKDFKYFSLPDVVADNSSSCDFVLGTPVKLTEKKIDLKNIKVVIEENGELVHEAMSSAALGDPVASLVEQVKLLWHYEKKSLPAGSVVLTGALTAAIALKPGQTIRSTYQDLGQIELEVTHAGR